MYIYIYICIYIYIYIQATGMKKEQKRPTKGEEARASAQQQVLQY